MQQIIQKWLGLDPFILIEFIDEEDDIRMDISHGIMGEDELIPVLEDVVAILKERNEGSSRG